MDASVTQPLTGQDIINTWRKLKQLERDLNELERSGYWQEMDKPDPKLVGVVAAGGWEQWFGDIDAEGRLERVRADLWYTWVRSLNGNYIIDWKRRLVMGALYGAYAPQAYRRVTGVQVDWDGQQYE